MNISEYEQFITERRQSHGSAKVFSPKPEHVPEVVSLIVAGGILALPWGAENRRIMILVCCFDNPEATRLLNEIKSRPAHQVLGIGCPAESVHVFADIEHSKPLVNAAKRILGVDQPTEAHLTKVLELIYERNSVGLMLQAKDSLPDIVTSGRDSNRKVLVLGASSSDENDLYNPVLSYMDRVYGKVVAGTSGNSHGRSVYSVASQQDLYEYLMYSVDGFVLLDQIPQRSPKPDKAASSTTFDLTGEKAILMRWGNQHPLSFRKFFPDSVIPKEVAKEVHRERIFTFIRRSLLG